MKPAVRSQAATARAVPGLAPKRPVQASGLRKCPNPGRPGVLTAAANRCAAASRGRSQTWIDSRRAAGAAPMTWAVRVNGTALPGSGVAAGPAERGGRAGRGDGRQGGQHRRRASDGDEAPGSEPDRSHVSVRYSMWSG